MRTKENDAFSLPILRFEIWKLHQKAQEIRFLLSGVHILQCYSFSPVTIWFNTVNKQNLLGFDRVSLTLTPSSDRHFQTNKAIDLGLVLFWSSLVVLCVSMKKSIMEASSDHIFIQTFTSISISPIFFFIYHLNILWKWIIGIMDIFCV